MGTQQSSYFPVAAEELAKWLERDPDLYWSVDGDRRLGGMVNFPCPGDELAKTLRKIGQRLLVLRRGEGSVVPDRSVAMAELDELVETEELGTRVLQFRWEDSDAEWLLIEDKETSESTAREISICHVVESPTNGSSPN